MRDVLVGYPGSDVLALSLKHIGDADKGVSTNAAFVASRQEGGKEELRAVISAQPGRVSARTRSYIETQLLSAELAVAADAAQQVICDATKGFARRR